MVRDNSTTRLHVDSGYLDLDDDDSDHSDFILPDEAISIYDFPLVPVTLTGPDRANSPEHLSFCQYKSLTLRVNSTVELDDGDFILIRRIARQPGNRETFLEGHLFRRTLKLEGLLEKKKNEVVWIQEYNPNKAGDIYRQSLQRVELHQVVALRDMILTNHIFPTGSYRGDVINLRLPNHAILQNCPLACRWKYLAHSEKEGTLVALSFFEADANYQRADPKRAWRGTTLIGGSCADWLPGEKAFDRAERSQSEDSIPFALHQPIDPLGGSGRRYTFGDGFCGAGGWSFDFNKETIDSYRMNFFETECWYCSADTLITSIPDNLKVDVLHLSFPCQPFSPAHTRPGKNDEANEASFFALEGVLKRAKPRVVMVEETFGLLRTADRMRWFRAMIQVFTKLGFSVRWKIFNLLEYGLPGRRERLFVYASCPGEALPTFPNPTHGSAIERYTKPYLAKYRTINDAISLTMINDPMPADSRPCNKQAYDGNVPLPNAICCSQTSGKHPSSQNIHPSGKRTFSSRELASLSTFPGEHKFGKYGRQELKKQIGNAVPPAVAKILLEQIVKSLRRADGL